VVGAVTAKVANKCSTTKKFELVGKTLIALQTTVIELNCTNS